MVLGYDILIETSWFFLNMAICVKKHVSHAIIRLLNIYKRIVKGFPGGAVVENLPANAGDTGSSPGLGRSHMPRSN